MSERWRVERRGGSSVLAAAFLAATVAGAAAEIPKASLLLERAELNRNPFLGVGIEVGISVASRDVPGELRRSSHLLITHRNDRSLLLSRPLEGGEPTALLVADDAYWLLLPGWRVPVVLPFQDVVAGDLSHAGVLRINLRVRYEARHDGEETLSGVPCWRLELLPREEPAPFARVRYWVTKVGVLPVRLEYKSVGREPLKTVRFVSFQDTSLGRRPERLEIEDARRPRETVTVTLSQPIRVDTLTLEFSTRDLEVMRRTDRRARQEGRGPAGVRELVGALREASAAGTDEDR